MKNFIILFFLFLLTSCSMDIATQQRVSGCVRSYAECARSYASDEEICKRAVIRNKIGDKVYIMWDTEFNYGFVKEARQRGIDCGISN